MKEIDLNYFNGLSIKEILALARKSIQITAENRKLEDKFVRLIEICNNQIQQCNCSEVDRPFDKQFECIEMRCQHYLATEQAKRIIEIIEEE